MTNYLLYKFISNKKQYCRFTSDGEFTLTNVREQATRFPTRQAECVALIKLFYLERYNDTTIN